MKLARKKLFELRKEKGWSREKARTNQCFSKYLKMESGQVLQKSKKSLNKQDFSVTTDYLTGGKLWKSSTAVILEEDKDNYYKGLNPLVSGKWFIFSSWLWLLSLFLAGSSFQLNSPPGLAAWFSWLLQRLLINKALKTKQRYLDKKWSWESFRQRRLYKTWINWFSIFKTFL